MNINDMHSWFDILQMKGNDIEFTRREKDYTRKIARSNKISYDEAWELYTKKAFDPYSTQHKPINLDMPGAPIFEEGVEWVTTFNQ